MNDLFKRSIKSNMSGLHMLFVLISMLLSFSSFAQSMNDSTAARTLLEIESRDEMAKTQEYEKVIKYYFAVAPQKAADLCGVWIKKAHKYNDKNSETDALINLSKSNIILGNFDQAGQTALDGVKLARKAGYLNGEAFLFGNLGVVAEMKGDNIQAIKHYLKADSIFSITGNLKNLAFVENNLGIVYNNIQLFDKSLEFYNKALKHKTEIADTVGLASTYVNIGVLYESLKKDYEKALHFYKVAGEIYDKYGLLPQRATIYNNIGLIYLNNGELIKSEESLLKALKIREQIGDNTGVASTKLNLALYAQKAGKLKDQIKYASESIAIFETAGIKPKIAESHRLLADIYENAGDPSSSLIHLKQYVSIRDSVLNEKSQKTVQELEAKYQNEVNQKRITILQQKNKIGKLVQIALILAIIIVILGFFSVFRQIKLTNKHKELEAENRFLRMQMNPHFIFNSIASIQGYMQNSDSASAMEYLAKFASLMRSVLNHSLKDVITLKEEMSYLENYFTLENIRRSNSIKWSIIAAPSIDSEEIMIPPMLVQPFVENAFKYAFTKDSQENKIEVVFEMEDDMLKVSIADNGVGITSTLGNNMGHISMATDIFRQRVNIMGKRWGKSVQFSIIDLADNRGKGTSVFFKIPV